MSNRSRKKSVSEKPSAATITLRQRVTDLWQQAEAALERKDQHQALILFQQTFAMSDQLPTVRLHLVVLLLEQDRLDEALVLLPGLQNIQPRYAQALNALGLYYERNRLEEQALACWEQALRADPAQVEVLSNMANTLVRIHQLDAGLACMTEAIRLQPDRVVLYYNRGLIYQARSEMDRALSDYTHVLQQMQANEPERIWSYLNSANIWTELNQWGKARTLLLEAIQINPEADYVQGTLLMTELFMAEWPNYFRQVQTVLAGIDAGKRVTPLLPLLALPAHVAQQNRAAAIYTDDRMPDCRPRERISRRSGRLRIAYVSSDFGQHAVSYLTAGLLTGHEVQHFEIFLYSLKTRNGDALLERIKTHVEHFVDISGMDDASVLALAKEQHIDIAVDLNGHTRGARTRLFAQGLAPVQVHYLGFPGGMGAYYYDYILADPVVIPPEHRTCYREKVVYLPGCFQVNDEQREPPQRSTREELGWPVDAFVFCCCNGTYKLNPIIFQVWLSILRQCTDSVLVVLGETEGIRTNLRTMTQEGRVDPQRLYFAKRLSYVGHLGRLANADLMLDTLPFNGGTSTSDALWAGVPVLTCTGDTFAGRMSTSLLHRAGLPELICPTLESYAQRAVELYQQRPWLMELRDRLGMEEVQQRLFATVPLTRAIERAYRQMQERYQAGLAAESFSV